jgi:hypothetical protein
MADIVNTVGSSVAAAPVGQQGAFASAAQADSATKTSASKSSAATVKTASVSALVYLDPLAGRVVTEQLDAQGNIVQQTPSSFALAYLRNGLTVEGYPRKSVTA